MIKKISTKSADQTEELGVKLGRNLRGGEVIELTSDLGGGKTTLTRGIARGAGSKDAVSSPTFTISNRYDAGRLTIQHFDFYRLPDAGLMEYELEDTVGADDQVVIVEWSDIVSHVLPEDRVTIHLQATSDNGRDLTLSIPDGRTYLVEGL